MPAEQAEEALPSFSNFEVRRWVHRTRFLEKDIFELVRDVLHCGALHPKCLILSSDLWGYFMHAEGLMNLFEASFSVENLQRGRIGNILGKHVYSDAYFNSDKKVLGPGEFVIITDPYPDWKPTGGNSVLRKT